MLVVYKWGFWHIFSPPVPLDSHLSKRSKNGLPAPPNRVLCLEITHFGEVQNREDDTKTWGITRLLVEFLFACKPGRFRMPNSCRYEFASRLLWVADSALCLRNTYCRLEPFYFVDSLYSFGFCSHVYFNLRMDSTSSTLYLTHSFSTVLRILMRSYYWVEWRLTNNSLSFL
jgi:hypothetical protein